MIRIHFTAADLGRVVFPAEPEPLWEAALAARALGDRAIPPAARRWRRQAGPLVRPSMRPLFKLIAPAGQFPDFLTPEVPAPGLDPAVEVLAGTPADEVRDQLGPWLPAEPEPFMRGLLLGRAGSRRALGIAVRDFHQQVLAPSAAELERRYGADLALRSRAVLQGGVDAMLGSLHPDITWARPVLTSYGLGSGSSFDIHLEGRGLQLYPSALTAECLALDAPGRRPVLVYPCSDLPLDDVAATDALGDLLGRTRAAVLRSLTASASTTQLARRCGISLASVSDHTRVLRAAGLVVTHRSAGAALHSLTPVAHRLLAGEHVVPAVRRTR
ncbi:regulatory protein ArsR [Kribbella flavida DSM 17836]|uniref:Regulatory protein ArsR n=1 Tax=Kribbella flavida (strain DSM 17836 / JCM 10339 / NBRC 14399) TaxID=479435 RepID=D2PVU4_KRIFD|nr:winged helix-turn-helix domain-containing protein [Kribbella flavida]ADB29601.1 regulatory protein ArsR [Kribbella flavida DSM 17836]